jgi:hypothetical protein
MWQEFEKFVSEIFSSHDYEVKLHHVFSFEGRRYEVDVLALHPRRVFGVDCKFYQKHWHRKSKLKEEARKHRERCVALSKVIKREVIPILVTLIDERVIFLEGCIISSHDKLNDFLVNAEIYLEELGLSL